MSETETNPQRLRVEKPTFTRYVLGVALNDRGALVMIRKKRPVEQVGKLNFPGGVVPITQSPVETLCQKWAREVRDYTDRVPSDWELFAVLQERGVFELECFRLKASCPPAQPYFLRVGPQELGSPGYEQVVLTRPEHLLAHAASGPVVEGCGWLAALALDRSPRNRIAIVRYGNDVE